MKDFFPILAASPLFSGVTEDELDAMLTCLAAKTEQFPKDVFLLHPGDTVEEVGLVLAGSALIVQEDIWGNRNILSRTAPGQTYAAAFACAPSSVSNVSVVTETPTAVLFLNVKRLLTVCPSACAHHSRIIRNLVGTLAHKNLALSRRSLHTGPRTIRARLLSYLGEQARRAGSRSFTIPFDRQQLADYLNVERSALSNELSKMQRDGLLTCRRSSFCLLCEF